MGKRTVIWSITAIKQRDDIFKYWNSKNKSVYYSRKLKELIRIRVGILSESPDVGFMVPNSETRTLTLGNYNIYYEFDAKAIYIISFWDNRQDPSKLYELLKK